MKASLKFLHIESAGGILYKIGHELVAAMNAIATDPERRRAMGERGGRAVEDRRSPAVRLTQYLSLLDRASGRRLASAS